MAFSQIEDDIEKAAPLGGSATLSFTAGEDVIAGQLVKLNGDYSVIPSDTDGENVIGFCTQTVPSGDACTVLVNGAVSQARAGLAVTEGDRLASHGASGEEGEVAPAATGDYVVATALESIGAGEYGNVLVTTAGGEVNA